MKILWFKSSNSWFKVLLVSFILFSESTSAQAPLSSSTDTLIKSTSYNIVKAGEEYNTSSFHQWLWGKHYRKEWDTPVKIRYIDLDSAGGGLTPTRLGGGRQSTTLHLIGENGKQYVLRSVNKTYTGALPEELHGTFIEKIVNDQVSTAHPYAAITIPPMISAAGLYHTKPEIVLVPDHKRLGKYRKQFAGMLVLFEERADEDQSDADHFGNTKNAVGTTKMMEKILRTIITRWIRSGIQKQGYLTFLSETGAGMKINGGGQLLMKVGKRLTDLFPGIETRFILCLVANYCR